MKLKGDTTCPHCKKEHDVKFDLDTIEPKTVKTPDMTNIQATTQTTVLEELPKPKEIIKTVAPKDQPFFKCKNCGDKHKNPNYSVKPNKKCPNCGSLNSEKACKNCNKATDSEEWEELGPEEMEELGIPEPTIKDNHEHEEE